MTQNISDEINKETLIADAQKQKQSLQSDTQLKEAEKHVEIDEKIPLEEYSLVLLGTNHKQKLFEKLLSSASRFERHIQYKDMFYLYYIIEGKTLVIELNDPGLEHTGAREMAVRKANAIILCYSAYNAASFHKLASLTNDFECRKKVAQTPPIVLMCNEDDMILQENVDNLCKTEQDDCNDSDLFTANSSTSEGYCSLDEQRPSSVLFSQDQNDIDNTTNEYNINKENISDSLQKKRLSMENIRLSNEECCRITREQGENMAKMFSDECQFISTSFMEYDGTVNLIHSLIKQIQESKSKVKNSKNKSTKNHSKSIENSLSVRLRRCRSSTADTSTSSLAKSSHLSLNLNIFSHHKNDSSKSGSGFHISPLFRRHKSKNKIESKVDTNIVSTEIKPSNNIENFHLPTNSTPLNSVEYINNFVETSPQKSDLIAKDLKRPPKAYRSNSSMTLSLNDNQLRERACISALSLGEQTLENRQTTKLTFHPKKAFSHCALSSSIFSPSNSSPTQMQTIKSSTQQTNESNIKVVEVKVSGIETTTTNDSISAIKKTIIEPSPSSLLSISADETIEENKKRKSISRNWMFRRSTKSTAKTSEKSRTDSFTSTSISHQSNVCTIS